LTIKDDDLKKLIIKLDELGLDFKITSLYDGYVFEGRNSYKSIQAIIPAEKNGWREFMKLKIEKQEKFFLFLISLFSRFIGYSPFCKYLEGKNIIYEWKRKNQEKRYNELINDEASNRINQLERL
jgi:hypothetical protein